MRFQKIALCAKSLCSHGHGRHKLAVAACASISAAGTLHAVRTVHDDAVGQRLHYRNIAEVNNKIVVAIDVTAFRQPNFISSCLAAFFNGIFHVFTREKLRLFDVYNTTRLGCFHEKICLPTEESGDLQHIDNLAGCGGLTAFMDIRQ